MYGIINNLILFEICNSFNSASFFFNSTKRHFKSVDSSNDNPAIKYILAMYYPAKIVVKILPILSKGYVKIYCYTILPSNAYVHEQWVIIYI